MEDLKKFMKIINKTIDNGTTSIEHIHKTISNMPFNLLEKIGPFEESSKNIKEFQENTIGNVYELIRKINNKTYNVTNDLLDKF